MPRHGDHLLEAAKAAKLEVVLIAPFIKANVLKRIIDNVSDSVSIQVFARWIPLEIAAGVCDLEIYDILVGRPGTALYVHPRLHAKVYRFDKMSYLGSANLTGKALGWSSPANIEVLISSMGQPMDFRGLEAELRRSSIRVDKAYQNMIREQVKALAPALTTLENKGSELVPLEPQPWLPTCPTPSRLWNVYAQGEGVRSRMVESSFIAAQTDLEALEIPSGLSEARFNQYVAAVLDGMSLIQAIQAAAAKGISPEEAAAMIEAEAGAGEFAYSPKDMWEVLRSWLIHFYPNQYRREPTAEVLRRSQVLI